MKKLDEPTKLEGVGSFLADKHEIDRLRSTLVALVSGGVGREMLAKLAKGQSTNTEEGRAWMRAAEMVAPNK